MFGPKLRSPEARHRRRVQLSIVTAMVGCLVVIVSGALLWLVNRPEFRLADITIYGTQQLDEVVVRETIETYLDGAYFNFFPKDSFFFFASSRLENHLREKYPRIGTLASERRGFTKLELVIQERSPFALWCGDIVPLELGPLADGTSTTTRRENLSTCYYLDESGYLYAKAPHFTGNPLNRFYGSLDSGQVLGQYFIPTDEFRQLYNLIADINEAGYRVRALLLVDEQDIEIYIDNSVRLLVARESDFTEVIDSFITLRDAGELDSQALERIEYIDLRFGSRVYVREVPIISEEE